METQAKNYIETVGRRKTASARVRLTEASKNSVTINDKELAAFFPVAMLQKIVMEALTNEKVTSKFKVTAVVKGGGMNGQADSVRHAIARALNEHTPEIRTTLKKLGYLKRDPRAKERRKFGLKKARKAPQWSKR